MDAKELLEASKRFGYRSIPTSERALLDALAIDKDGGTDPVALTDFAAVLEFVESSPKLFLNKKDQLELSDFDTNKGVCLSLWSDDVDQIEKFRALCRANLPKDLGWFHQSNSQDYQMFEFWKPQSEAMRNIANQLGIAMQLPLITILKKEYRPEVSIKLDTFADFDPNWCYERGHFNGQ